MLISNFPFCCTSAVLGSFGEHGEPSLVSVKEIQRMVKQELASFQDLGGHARGGHARCIFATTIDPKNLEMLLAAGFKEVDQYTGIQGIVHILTLHANGV